MDCKCTGLKLGTEEQKEGSCDRKDMSTGGSCETGRQRRRRGAGYTGPVAVGRGEGTAVRSGVTR